MSSSDSTNTPPIPYGYCHCGCGKKTKIAAYSFASRGWVKGEPRHYVSGHNGRTNPREQPGQYREEWSTLYPDIPYGHCLCGCGEKTLVPLHNNASKGWIAGKPCLYRRGHHPTPSGAPRKRQSHYGHNYAIDSDTGCWVWQGWIGDKGYGRIRFSHGTVGAHRVFYEQHKGAIPEGLTLDHLCRNRACVNPEHLEPVTAAENIRRGWDARQST